MTAEPLLDVRTLLSQLPTWHFRLPEDRAALVEGLAVTARHAANPLQGSRVRA